VAPEPCSTERERRHHDDEALGAHVGGWTRRRRRCRGGTDRVVARWGVVSVRLSGPIPIIDF
jgi:hypothetical protein